MASNTSYGRWGTAQVIPDDVLQIIFQITPEDTPHYNDIGMSTAKGVLHYWNTREITVRQHNAVQEKESYSGNFGALQLPSQVANICQIIRKLPEVSGTMQATGVQAVPDLMADQMAQALVGWKTDCEHAILRGSLGSGASGDATARRLGGFYNVISDNKFDYGSTGTFNETNFANLIEAVWSDGGKPSRVLSGYSVKRVIGKFTNLSTINRYVYGEDKQVTQVVNIVETDGGVVECRISRDVRNAVGQRDCLVYDPSFFAKAFLRPVRMRRLPETADSEQGLVLGELTYEYGNEKAAGMLFSLVGLA